MILLLKPEPLGNPAGLRARAGLDEVQGGSGQLPDFLIMNGPFVPEANHRKVVIRHDGADVGSASAKTIREEREIIRREFICMSIIGGFGLCLAG